RSDLYTTFFRRRWLMARQTKLRAVSADETPARPESVSVAVQQGSPRDVNIAMQDRIAKAIDAEDIRGADLAALSRRLHELRKELAAMDAQAKEAVEDEPVG